MKNIIIVMLMFCVLSVNASNGMDERLHESVPGLMNDETIASSIELKKLVIEEEVVTGIPVVDVLNIALTTAIKIVGKSIEKKITKELGIDKYIKIATEGIEGLEDLWQESLETIKSIVSDYSGLEAMIRKVADTSFQGIVGIGELENSEFIGQEQKEIMAKVLEYKIEITSTKLEDLDALLEDGSSKMTDSERLSQIDKLRGEVALANRDIESIRSKTKFLNQKFSTNEKNAAKMNTLFGG